VRLSLAASMDRLQAALERIEKFLVE